MLEWPTTQHITSIPDTKGIASINFSWASASISELFEFPYNNIDQFLSFCRIPSTGAPVFFLLLCSLFICGRDWVERTEKDDYRGGSRSVSSRTVSFSLLFAIKKNTLERLLCGRIIPFFDQNKIRIINTFVKWRAFWRILTLGDRSLFSLRFDPFIWD